jgi:hypothetical protein
MKTHPSPATRQRGTAIVVVLAVLVLIVAFMAGNNVTLRSLHREVQLIEKRQLRKYGRSDAASGAVGRATPAASGTVAPAASEPSPPMTDSQPK